MSRDAVVLLFVVYIYSCLAISVKRLHDRNKNAWWLLIIVLPQLNARIFDLNLHISVVEWSPSVIVAAIFLWRAGYGTLSNLPACVERLVRISMAPTR